MRDVFIKQLLLRAIQDDRIMLLTGDLGFKVFDEFIATCPSQFLNVGVAEQNMTGVAAGLAHEGHIVFTYSIANFVSLRCLEQIRNDICYPGLNVTMVCIGGGLSYGPLGASHHATEDIAIMRALPEMRVFCPGDSVETAALTNALVDTPGPSYLRLERGGMSSPTDGLAEGVEVGISRKVREGKDCTLICTGGILEEVYSAAALLSKESQIECRVLSMHTVSPIDQNALVAAAKETPRVVVIEEHRVHGGLRGAVAEVYLAAGVVPQKYLPLGLDFGFCRDIGSQEYLREVYGLSVAGIVNGVRSIL